MPPLCRAPFPDPVASWLFKAKNWSKEPESRGSADTAAVGGGCCPGVHEGHEGDDGDGEEAGDREVAAPGQPQHCSSACCQCLDDLHVSPYKHSS